MKKVNLLLIAAISFIGISCNQQQTQNQTEPEVGVGVGVAGPEAIIYRTKGDYDRLVPVILNKEKNKIVSYPAPTDLKYKGEIAIPTVLENGFLLDNRGINADVAFINMTYEEYMALEKSPPTDELMGLIVDYDPLVEMYSCGKRSTYTNEVEELNAFILKEDFSSFRQLK
jgi:hypothetical protein